MIGVVIEVAEDFLTTDETGWGVGGQQVRKGGQVEVHGSPEGTLRVSDEDAGASADFKWADVLAEGKAQQGPVRIEVISNEGTQWVHVRVEDEDSGDRVGCRIHFPVSKLQLLTSRGAGAHKNPHTRGPVGLPDFRDGVGKIVLLQAEVGQPVVSAIEIGVFAG